MFSGSNFLNEYNNTFESAINSMKILLQIVF